jgi:peptide/nickel transport system permease protein
MSSFLKYFLNRLLTIPITLLVITAILFAIIMQAPAEERAMLYFPPRTRPNMTPEQFAAIRDNIINEHGLNDPFPQQYFHWLGNLLKGNWGYSPTFNADVWQLLKQHLGVTVELTIYSLLLLFPLALLFGLLAGWFSGSLFDTGYRFTSFTAMSIPPFILGLFLLSIFYVGFRWFPPGRVGVTTAISEGSGFETYTGLLTVDGLLNRRYDVMADAFRHLVLPVFTLCLLHWATISRVTRVAVVDEKHKDYILSAKSRGITKRSIVGRHTFRNALLPALTVGVLSAATLITGVYVVERIFDLNGLSKLITYGFQGTPDAPLALGFAVLSVLLVLPIMVGLDLLKGVVDPRIREEGDDS